MIPQLDEKSRFRIRCQQQGLTQTIEKGLGGWKSLDAGLDKQFAKDIATASVERSISGR
jgi:hypothetical protein